MAKRAALCPEMPFCPAKVFAREGDAKRRALLKSQGDQSIQNQASNEEDTKDRIQLGGDGIGSFRDLFHKTFQEVNGFGEREEDEQTPGAQDSQDNHSHHIQINSQDEACVEEEAFPAAEQNPDGFDSLA